MASSAYRDSLSSGEKPAEAIAYPLNRDLVWQALTAVQRSGIYLLHPMSSGDCKNNNCPPINVTGTPPSSSSSGGDGGGAPSPIEHQPSEPTGSPGGKSGQTCFAPLSAKPRANQAKVDSHELGPANDRSGPGGMALNGYVPNANSGVTIGFGVDLGQLSVSTLQSYGVPQSIIDELKPWIGPKGQKAQAVLNGRMLTLTSADATTLSNDVFNGVYNSITANFDNNNSMTFYSYKQLPAGAQTALVDMEYNNGDIWDAASSLVQDAANDAASGNWAGMVQDLGILGKTTARYRDDQTAIQDAIDMHLLPAKANLDNGKGGECPQS